MTHKFRIGQIVYFKWGNAPDRFMRIGEVIELLALSNKLAYKIAVNELAPSGQRMQYILNEDQDVMLYSDPNFNVYDTDVDHPYHSLHEKLFHFVDGKIQMPIRRNRREPSV